MNIQGATKQYVPTANSFDIDFSAKFHAKTPSHSGVIKENPPGGGV